MLLLFAHNLRRSTDFNVSDPDEMALRSHGFVGVAFDQWQHQGHDEHGAIANPMFLDSSRGDYRMRADSPALLRGFEQLNLATVGPDW
eukprot:SAG31_NODE_3096_length_4680_cov_1.703995_3_plen_88_part_00